MIGSLKRVCPRLGAWPRRSAALTLALGCWALINAQESAKTSWSLQDCIDYALANNLEVKQKEIAYKQTEVDIYANKGALFPSLSFSTNQSVSWRPWSKSYVNVQDGTMSTTTSTVNYNGSYGLQAQWNFWDGGASRKRYQRSKVARDRAVADESVTRMSIQEEIIQAYVSILYQTAAVDVNRQILESTKVLRDRAKTMYEVGEMSLADYSQMESQVSQEEYNVTNSMTQLAEFKQQLKTILEITGPTEIEIEIPAIADETITGLLPDVASVYAYALSSRPEIRYSQLGVELADMDIDIAKRGYYPTIGLSAGVNTNNASGMNQKWYDQIKTNLSNSIGLTVSVPIFDNSQTSASVKRARLERESSLAERDQQMKQLYNEIETIWLNATNAREQYVSALKNSESMQQSYLLVSEQFSVGLKDIVDLTTGKNNLIQARQQELQAKYTAVLNRALLNFYNGTPLTLN